MSTLGDSFTQLEASLLGEPDYDDSPPELALADRDGVNRHLWHIRRIRREVANDVEVAEALILRTQEWLVKRRLAALAAERWHADVLERYHAAVLAVDGRLKTIQLPEGTLRARAQQPEWEWAEDGAVFLAWAALNRPDLLANPPPPPPPRVDINKAKAALTREVRNESGKKVLDRIYGFVTDGELVGVAPPGVKVTPRDDKYDFLLATDDE